MITMQICSDCGRPFEIYSPRARGQRRCPTCADVRQKRPSVVLHRKVLAIYDGVTIRSLPGEWLPFVAAAGRDESEWRMEVRGEDYGDAWDGTIVLHASQPFGPGDVVRFRHMRAVHKVKRAVWTRRTSGFVIASGGPETVTHSVPVPFSVPDNVIRDYALRAGEPGNLLTHPSAAEAEAEGRLRVEEVEEAREYIVLHPSSRAGQFVLRWVETIRKHTLKGLGAQYTEALDAPTAVWRKSVWGGTRNGRRRTTGTLLVVPAGEEIAVESVGYSGGNPPLAAPYTWRRTIAADSGQGNE